MANSERARQREVKEVMASLGVSSEEMTSLRREVRQALGVTKTTVDVVHDHEKGGSILRVIAEVPAVVGENQEQFDQTFGPYLKRYLDYAVDKKNLHHNLRNRAGDRLQVSVLPQRKRI